MSRPDHLETAMLDALEAAHDRDHMWDAFTFDGDELHIENHHSTETVICELALVTREATREEYAALKAAYAGHLTPSDASSPAERIFISEGLRMAERDGDDFADDPVRTAVAGRIPNPILYNTDGGPHYFGHGANFRGIEDFDPDDAEYVIEEGSWAEYAGADTPQIDVFHPDTGYRYTLSYEPVAVEQDSDTTTYSDTEVNA